MLALHPEAGTIMGTEGSPDSWLSSLAWLQVDNILPD